MTFRRYLYTLLYIGSRTSRPGATHGCSSLSTLIAHRLRRHQIPKAPSTHWHRAVFATVLCFFVIGFVASVAAPRKQKRRTQDNRVYLNHADELRYDVYGPNPDAQIVKGHVSFTHQGSHLTCDSAYFYQGTNSVKAFGHVRFHQGDTLSLTCDHAWYDGEAQLMEARKNVVLRHRGQTLYTDSLNYDRLYNNAYFFRGGRLIDKQSKLSSDWGEYNTETKQAVFYYDVQLRTPKTHVSTDTLYYDTRRSQAHVVGQYTSNRGLGKVGPSRIVTDKNTINTVDAYFYTNSDQAQMYGRSTVEDKDKTITGDTLIYNSKTGRDRAYGNVVYVDKKNKNELTCGEAVYNEKTGYGYATRHALVKDYSQKDTLYMHADTLRIKTFHINTDSVYRMVFCYNKVKAYRRDVQAICDSLVFNSKDSCMSLYKDPILWSDNRQLLGEVIRVYMNDTTIREARVLGQAFSVEQMPDSTHYNQISSRDMYAYFVDGVLRRSDAVSNVRSINYFVDDKDSSFIGLDYNETDTMRMFMNKDRKLERIWMPKPVGVLYPMTQIPPDKYKLDCFVWFADLRPTDPEDVFHWRGKSKGSELKSIVRRGAPLQHLGSGGSSSGASSSGSESAASSGQTGNSSSAGFQNAGSQSASRSSSTTKVPSRFAKSQNRR
jgi:lipopolysaccharide export system protein LptA